MEKPDGDVKGACLLMFHVYDVSSIDTESEAAKVCSITEFFSDDPNIPYIHPAYWT
ncbi:MAG: hypothetical protein WBP64_21990 [Nitrososphaeraceae archaeon]